MDWPEASDDAKQGQCRHSQLPQPLERLQNPLDLLGAFLVFATEIGGKRFGVIRSGETLFA